MSMTTIFIMIKTHQRCVQGIQLILLWITPNKFCESLLWEKLSIPCFINTMPTGKSRLNIVVGDFFETAHDG